MNKAPTTLIIMDGFGLSNDTVGNAVRAANTPVLDGLFSEYAHTTLKASGLDVGPVSYTHLTLPTTERV